jgi:hypothetical protein
MDLRSIANGRNVEGAGANVGGLVAGGPGR